MSLANKTVWIVGGVGPIGRNIARSLLIAGANVIVNSRSENRLEKLAKDLSEHPRLIPVHGSLLPGKAADTVQRTLSYSSNDLDHVIAHGAVRWWANKNTGFSSMDESRMTVATSGFLENDVDEFMSASQQSLRLQFSAAQHLMPRLQGSLGPSTYTFVTGESGNSLISRNPQVVVGSRSIQGLAECVRQECRKQGQHNVSSCEIRVGMAVNRSAEERAQAPRTVPLSSSVGDIVAGVCSNAGAEDKLDNIYYLKNSEELARVAEIFPVEADRDTEIQSMWNWEGGGQQQKMSK